MQTQEGRTQTARKPENEADRVPKRKLYVHVEDTGTTLNCTAMARLVEVPESSVITLHDVHAVVHAAQAIAGSRRELSASTINAYQRRLDRLRTLPGRPKATADLLTWLPSQGTARTAQDWGIWRGAILWRLDVRATEMLRELDRLQRRLRANPDLLPEILQRAEKLRGHLNQRQNVATMLKPALKKRRGMSPKKRVLDKVEKFHERQLAADIAEGLVAAEEAPDFMEKHWAYVNRSTRYAAGIAVSMVAGARTGEISSEVLVRQDGVHVIIVLKTLKVGYQRQDKDMRAIKVGDSGPARYLRRLVEANNGEDVIIPRLRDDCLRRAMVKAGVKAFPNLKARLTPSVYRHCLRANMIADGFGQETIAMALGHSDGGSQSRYGLGRVLRGGPRVIQVMSNRPVKVRPELTSAKIKELRATKATTPAIATAVEKEVTMR